MQLIPWTRKYFPNSSSEVVGQQDALRRLREFVESYAKKRKKAMLIYGPVGCGKTSSVYGLAKELHYEILEVNASDVRNEAEIKAKVGAASQQISLFSKGKIILVDELDGISGTEDRGGIPALIRLLDKSSFPIIAIANDPWDKRFSQIRKSSEILEYNSLDYKQVESVLKNICSSEKITFDEEAVKALALRSGGDLRGAITDLQMLAVNNTLTKEDVDSIDSRDREESIVKAITKVLKSTNSEVAKTAFDNVSENIQECFLWLDENLPHEYTNPKELAKAYEMLSLADLFYGRIKRWQHWRFLVYVYAFATVGIATAKKERYSHIIAYKRTSRLLKLYIANMKYRKRLAIAQRLAEKMHSSTSREIQSSLPYLKLIFKQDKNTANSIAEELELSREESEWLSQ